MFSVPLSFGFWSSCHPACPALHSLHSVLISLAALAAGACRVRVPPLAMGHLSSHPPLLGKAPQLGPEAEAQLVSSYPALSRIWALLGTGLAPVTPMGWLWVPSAGPVFLPLDLHSRVSGLTPRSQGKPLPFSLQPQLPLSCHRRPS